MRPELWLKVFSHSEHLWGFSSERGCSWTPSSKLRLDLRPPSRPSEAPSSLELLGLRLQPLLLWDLRGLSSPLDSCAVEPLKMASHTRFCRGDLSSLGSVLSSLSGGGRTRRGWDLPLCQREGEGDPPSPSPAGRRRQRGCPAAGGDAGLGDAAGERGKGAGTSSSPAWVSWGIFLFLNASASIWPRFGSGKSWFGGKNKA